jgi:spermidine synthase/MFS family permease
MERKRILATYVVVFCVAAATMAYELLQTRVLSVLFYNHVVYLTVTIALLGFGISGVLVSIFSRRGVTFDSWITLSLAGFTLSSFLCIRFASFTPLLFESTKAKLLFCYMVLVLPFLFAGAALGLIFMTHARRIYSLYFTDLLASALGGVAFTFLLRPLGADLLVWSIAGILLFAFLTYGLATRVSLVFSGAVLAICLAAFFIWRVDLLNEQPEPYKIPAQVYRPDRPDARIEASEWTTIAKIDILSDPKVNLITHRPDPNASSFKELTQDGDAFAILPGLELRNSIFEEANGSHPMSAQNLGYLIRPHPEASLIIGVGGGMDIVPAKAFGAKQITGVEINPATVDLMKNRYADYLQWPKWDNVNLQWAEGRHYVKSTDQQFDTITLSGVDTFSALSAGAYVLSENYLYTVEAIEDYLKALKPDGIATIFRWLFQYPRESLRLANLYVTAAERMGLRSPSQSVMIVAVDFGWQYRWAATIFKKKPFTPDEVDRILGQIKKQSPGEQSGTQSPLTAVYIPDVFPKDLQEKREAEFFQYDKEYMAPARDAFMRLIRAGSKEERRAFEKEYSYNVAPVYDDRPFFFEYHKLQELFANQDKNQFGIRGVIVHYVLYVLLGLTGIATILGIMLPLYVFEREGLKVKGAWPLLAFFSSLGVGFMFIELGVIQRLNLYLGHPMYSLAVVLSGLLLCTGIGSYRAGKRNKETPMALRDGMLGSAIVSLAWLIGSFYVIPWTMGWPLWARVLLTLLSLYPIGLQIGVPFATGLRYLENYYPRFIPWAWGVNGLTSVMASILAILIAMRTGFTAVIVLGSLTYILGYLAIRRHLQTEWRLEGLPSPITCLAR